MFTRTFSYQTQISREALKNRLIGNHLNIHNLDFEVMEKSEYLRIVPHAEQVDEIKALPITYVELTENNGRTKVKITSRMRKLDVGAPMLVAILCILLLAASGALLLFKEQLFGTLLIILDVLIYATFRLRLERSYFDYVRQIRLYILDRCPSAL
jgi:hypothetical protein